MNLIFSQKNIGPNKQFSSPFKTIPNNSYSKCIPVPIKNHTKSISQLKLYNSQTSYQTYLIECRNQIHINRTPFFKILSKFDNLIQAEIQLYQFSWWDPFYILIKNPQQFQKTLQELSDTCCKLQVLYGKFSLTSRKMKANQNGYIAVWPSQDFSKCLPIQYSAKQQKQLNQRINIQSKNIYQNKLLQIFVNAVKQILMKDNCFVVSEKIKKKLLNQFNNYKPNNDQLVQLSNSSNNSSLRRRTFFTQRLLKPTNLTQIQRAKSKSEHFKEIKSNLITPYHVPIYSREMQRSKLNRCTTTKNFTYFETKCKELQSQQIDRRKSLHYNLLPSGNIRFQDSSIIKAKIHFPKFNKQSQISNRINNIKGSMCDTQFSFSKKQTNQTQSDQARKTFQTSFMMPLNSSKMDFNLILQQSDPFLRSNLSGNDLMIESIVKKLNLVQQLKQANESYGIKLGERNCFLPNLTQNQQLEIKKDFSRCFSSQTLSQNISQKQVKLTDSFRKQMLQEYKYVLG